MNGWEFIASGQNGFGQQNQPQPYLQARPAQPDANVQWYSMAQAPIYPPPLQQLLPVQQPFYQAPISLPSMVRANVPDSASGTSLQTPHSCSLQQPFYTPPAPPPVLELGIIRPAHSQQMALPGVGADFLAALNTSLLATQQLSHQHQPGAVMATPSPTPISRPISALGLPEARHRAVRTHVKVRILIFVS